MPRNLDREELMFPYSKEELKERIIRIMRAQMSDNQRARLLKQDGVYERVAAGRSAAPRRNAFTHRVWKTERRSLTRSVFVPNEGRD
jgi:polyphosphate kinase